VCDCTELTAIYVTARTGDTQQAAKMDLDAARKNTDKSLMKLVVWPPADTEAAASAHVSAMFRSRHMFAAILAGHRTSVRVGAYFWDEVRLCYRVANKQETPLPLERPSCLVDDISGWRIC